MKKGIIPTKYLQFSHNIGSSFDHFSIFTQEKNTNKQVLPSKDDHAVNAFEIPI